MGKRASLKTGIIIKITLISLFVGLLTVSFLSWKLENSYHHSLQEYSKQIREKKNQYISDVFRNLSDKTQMVLGVVEEQYSTPEKVYKTATNQFKLLLPDNSPMEGLIYDGNGKQVQYIGASYVNIRSNYGDEQLERFKTYGYDGYRFLDCTSICYFSFISFINKNNPDLGYLLLRIPIDAVVYELSHRENVDISVLIKRECSKQATCYKMDFTTNYSLTGNLTSEPFITEEQLSHFIELNLPESIYVSDLINISLAEYKSPSEEIKLLVIRKVERVHKEFVKSLREIITFFLATLLSIIAITYYSLSQPIRYIANLSKVIPDIGKTDLQTIETKFKSIKKDARLQEVNTIHQKTYSLAKDLDTLHKEINQKNHNLQEALESQSEKLEFINELINTGDALFVILDKNFSIKLHNRFAESIFEDSDFRLKDKDFLNTFKLTENADKDKLDTLREHVVNEQVLRTNIISSFRSDNEKFNIVLWYMSALSKEKNHSYQVIGVGVDITERVKMEENIKYLANIDPLTSLFNRRYFTEKINRLYDENIPFYLINIDVDNFKLINDSYGHDFGDVILKGVAGIIKLSLPEDCFCSRNGGDEFILALPHKSKAFAEDYANRLVETIKSNKFRHTEEHITHVRISLGLAHFPSDTKELSILYAYADAAMYENKKSRMGSYHFYSGKETLIKRRHDIQFWNEVVSEAIAEDRITPYFQAVVRTTDYTVLFYEVLSRITDQQGHIIHSPSEYIQFISEHYLIIKMDEYLIQCILEKFSNAPVQPVVSINLSAKSISSPEMFDFILSQIEKYQYPPERIIFEITEQSPIHNMNATIKFIKQFTAMGVRFALDDFGTGFSSLSMLQQLPIHFLKIDKSLLEGAEHNEKSLKLLEQIVAMAKALDIEIIIEGVETFLSYRIAATLNIDYCQGYFFSRPHEDTQLPLQHKLGDL